MKKFQEKSAPDHVICRCITQLFPRIVDLENFGNLINICSLQLKNEIIHRLGILNVWCPMMAGNKNKLFIIFPLSFGSGFDESSNLWYSLSLWIPIDGDYEFDLASKDHREAATLIIRLAAIEPGQNVRNWYYDDTGNFVFVGCDNFESTLCS